MYTWINGLFCLIVLKAFFMIFPKHYFMSFRALIKKLAPSLIVRVSYIVEQICIVANHPFPHTDASAADDT